MTLTHIKYGIAIVAILSVLFLIATYRTPPAYGSVPITDEYMSTSTAANSAYGATVTGAKVIKYGPGAFGSYIITGANTGIINFYDATTSNVNARTGQKATSTILLASFPASTVAGTYTFDAALTAGLYVDVVSGIMATGTVTYRN